MRFVIDPPERVVVPTVSGELFPVRRVFCVGRNYAAHAREMGHDPDREAPFFFTKPADALLTDGAAMPYPSLTQDLQYELEQVVAMGVGGADIPVEEALTHVWGYGSALDMTRRDQQGVAKKAGRPWDMAKGFDYSAPIGALVPGDGVDPGRGRVQLRVNGTVRQESDLANLIWSVPETIAHLSRFVRLAPGDLIFTGTPDGVGTVVRGDELEGFVEGAGTVRTRIV